MGKLSRFHCPWVDPLRPLPPWLSDASTPAVDAARTIHRSYEYYRHLYRATPRWATRASISDIYKRAAQMRASGFNVEVDHIIPLNHPQVCGLHCVDNLQIISRDKNANKSNKTDLDGRYLQHDLFGGSDNPEQLGFNL